MTWSNRHEAVERQEWLQQGHNPQCYERVVVKNEPCDCVEAERMAALVPALPALGPAALPVLFGGAAVVGVWLLCNMLERQRKRRSKAAARRLEDTTHQAINLRLQATNLRLQASGSDLQSALQEFQAGLLELKATNLRLQASVLEL